MRTVSLAAIASAFAAPLGAQQAGARAELVRADAALSVAAFTSGMLATFPHALGSAGVIVWPGAGVVQGEAEAVEFFRRQALLADAKLSWQLFRIEMSPDSSLALVTGVTVIDRLAAEPWPAIHRFGRYLAAWRRADGVWRLSAFSLVNTLTTAETIWTSAIGPVELPLLRSTGPAAQFIAADSAFAADAGALGAAKGFAKWASTDATLFAPNGEANVGPEQIGAIFAGNTARWAWGAVAAGSSSDGTLGWTVGQATITPSGGGTPSKSKYLTLWRRMADGSIKFIADGGSARP